MKFIIEQLQQLGMVTIIMACALGGTIGILRLLKRFLPGRDFPKDPIAKRQKRNRKIVTDKKKG